MLNLTRFNHAQDFLDVAEESLYQNEALNCLMIGVVGRLVDYPDYFGEGKPYLGVVSLDGRPILAGTMTPPFGLLVAPLAEDAKQGLVLLMEGLIREGITPPDVHGVIPYGRQFAELWAARTGGRTELEMAQRIYKLEEVNPPAGVPGTFLPAEEQHADLVTTWMQAFERESFGTAPRDFDQLHKNVGRRIRAGDWFLWQDGGEVVSMCLRTRPTRTGCSISGVYTPPELRRKGYATACVAALSQKLLDDGFSFTSLFTDLSNPTSNSIYIKIGYQPLADFDKYRLVK